MRGRLIAGVAGAGAGMRGRLIAGVAVALLAVAGCAAEPPVSPLPIEAATTSAVRSLPASISPTPPAVSRSPDPPRSPAAATTPPRPNRTTASPSKRPPSCEGAVVHTIDVANDELALVRGMCLAVGAVLRIENIGPGEVTTDAADLVDQHYEAGVVEIRFVRPGTVIVTIPQNGRPYQVKVVVR